jgi:hypothetical protein
MEGYVALIDVLGFSQLVRGERAADRLASYREGLEGALAPEPEEGIPVVEYVVFSDTIVVTTSDDSEPSLQALLRRSSTLFGIMLEKDIALRGAIACGSFERHRIDRGSVFVAGPAIVDAFDFEKRQDWVGIMLAPSAYRRVPHLKGTCWLEAQNPWTSDGLAILRERFSWSAFVQAWPSIPFHAEGPFDSNRYDGFAVVPSSGMPEPVAVRDSIASALRKLEWLKSLAPDPRAQAKYVQAHGFLAQVHNSWRNIASAIEYLAGEASRAAEDARRARESVGT